MFCNKCGRYIYAQDHICPPNFWIAHEEYLGEDLEKVYAHDYEEAAKNYAEEWDRYDCEYSIAGKGEELKIQVFDNPDRENGKTFIVTGETVPRYDAKEIIE